MKLYVIRATVRVAPLADADAPFGQRHHAEHIVGGLDRRTWQPAAAAPAVAERLWGHATGTLHHEGQTQVLMQLV